MRDPGRRHVTLRRPRRLDVQAPARPEGEAAAPTAPAPASTPVREAPSPTTVDATRVVALQRAAGNRAVAGWLGEARGEGSSGDPRPPVQRAVDASKASAIRTEMDTFGCKHLGMTGDLENLWNQMGKDLPAAVNDPAYRDLWFTSVNDRKMNIDNASRSLRATFERDTREATTSLAGKKKGSLEELHKDLTAAAKENRSRPPDDRHLVEDDKAQKSRIAGEKRLNVRDLIDTATLVDFLRNWDELLRSVPVGTRRPDSAKLLPPPGAPTSPGAPGADPFGLGGGPAGAGGPTVGPQFVHGDTQPVLFDPATPQDRLPAGGDVTIDADRVMILRGVHQECTQHQTDFRELAASLIHEDANLAAIVDAPDKGLLRKVSGLRNSNDAEATSTIIRVTGENIKVLDALLGITPTMDWRGLKPVHGMLLGGAYRGASGVAWPGLVERTFIEGYFKRQAEAERAAAEQKMYTDLAIGAVTFLALLSPAAPLAAAVLAAANVYGAAQAVGGAATADKDVKKADDLDTAAQAGFADTEEAKRAKKEANDRKAGTAMDLLLAAMPFMPGVAKAAAGAAKGAVGAAGALGAAGRFAGAANETTSLARVAVAKRTQVHLRGIQRVAERRGKPEAIVEAGRRDLEFIRERAVRDAQSIRAGRLEELSGVSAADREVLASRHIDEVGAAYRDMQERLRAVELGHVPQVVPPARSGAPNPFFGNPPVRRPPGSRAGEGWEKW